MKVLHWLDEHLEEFISTLLLMAMTFCIFTQIIFRATGAPLSWTEELSRYLFVWLIYISCSLAIRHRAHIKVDVMSLLVKRRGQLVLDLISDVAFFIFIVIIAYYGSQTVYKLLFVRPQVSAGIKAPMWIPYLSIVVGGILMALRLIQSVILRIREYKNPAVEGEVA